MAKNINEDNNSPFVNAVVSIGLLVAGFFYILDSWADVSVQIRKDRAQNPNAWRGMDRVYILRLWEEVEIGRWNKRIERWSGETNKAESQKRGEPEIKGVNPDVGGSWASQPADYEEYKKERVFSSAVYSYTRKLMNEQLSIGKEKFLAEDVEHSVLETEGKKRTVVFTVTACDNMGYSLGFAVDITATFEYDETNRGTVGRIVGGPAWKVVDEKGASNKRKVPKKFKCCSTRETDSLLKEKPFPHKRDRGIGRELVPKRNMPIKMLRNA